MLIFPYNVMNYNTQSSVIKLYFFVSCQLQQFQQSTIRVKV